MTKAMTTTKKTKTTEETMKRQTECVAMLLAGGQGSRLKTLTTNVAKPAIHFGGKYRIIDFALSNCVNSGIDTVGVVTQYKPHALNKHLGEGKPWNLKRSEGGLTVLPPAMREQEMSWYTGTANAVYQNLNYIEQHNPEYVLILSGDHIYNMDYRAMIEHHKQTGAEATISVMEVKWEEASRFGILSVNDKQRVERFSEKPKQPDSNLASMGIYIFNRELLKTYLNQDEQNPTSTHDFGKDVIPSMLEQGVKLFAYPFEGYWRDVGTVDSLWEAHMDLLGKTPEFQLNTEQWPLFTASSYKAPQYVSEESSIFDVIISEGCQVYGHVSHSVLSSGVKVEEGTVIHHSIIMPNVKIGKNVVITNAIIGEGTVIEDGAQIGTMQGITLLCKEDMESKEKLSVFTAREHQLLRVLERIG